MFVLINTKRILNGMYSRIRINNVLISRRICLHASCDHFQKGLAVIYSLHYFGLGKVFVFPLYFYQKTLSKVFAQNLNRM